MSKLIIFDMDGTILNTLDDLTSSLNYALETNTLPKRTVSEVRSFVGDGIRKLVERGVPNDSSNSIINQVYDCFIKHYYAHCHDQTKPYQGIIELLKKLQNNGYQLAVVSNKDECAVKTLCELYFNGLFNRAVGVSSNVLPKPAPDLVNAVLQKLNCSSSETIYIGDSVTDIETADNAGIACISVDWGFRDRSFLLAHGAKTIVSTTEELFNILVKEA